MSPSPPKEKKNSSLSFTDSHLTTKDTEKKHYRQFRSHEHKLNHEEEQSVQEKVKLQNLLTKKIEEHNQYNSTKHKPYQWELVMIDEKRTITGFKSKIKCKLVPSELYLVVRISFTQEFFKLGEKLQEGTIFVELEELNFEISKMEKRNFQVDIEKGMKPLFLRTVFAENEEEHKWVKELFAAIEAIIENNDYQKRAKKSSESLNRKEILTKYILYHSPVCLTWNPKGQFCLTENKVPATKCSLIGNPLSFKQNIEVPKVSLKTVIEEEFSDLNQETPQLSIFKWNMSEELELFALNNHQKREISSYYKDNSSNSNRKDIESRKKLTSNTSLVNTASNSNNNSSSNNTNNNNNSVKNDYIILEYGWKKLSPNMRKIYERYFATRNDFLYDITRGEKLNVYFVLSENRRYEDEMLYLMEKINTDKLKPPLEVILSTMLASYPGLLSAQHHKTLDSTRYFIISELLKEERLKSTSSPFNLSLCLKSIMIENEFHSLELESYFTQCFTMLNVNNSPSKYNIYHLGSYMHFDEYRAECILIKLLEQYEYHYEMNLKNEKEVRFVLQAKNQEKIKKYIKVKKIVKFPQIKDDWLLNDDQRKKFIETILPILLVRDSNFEEFYYRQLERIITTNQKILKFFKTLSQIIKKVEEERHEFIKSLIDEYTAYEQEFRLKDQVSGVRRLFTVYCQKCQRPNKTFEIAETEKLRICARCSSEKVNHQKA